MNNILYFQLNNNNMSIEEDGNEVLFKIFSKDGIYMGGIKIDAQKVFDKAFLKED